jgi:NADH-quinone oxidoreductase subunit M
MVFSVLASAGLPGLNGFVGEFLILLGAFKSTVVGSPVLIAFATTGVILAAVYLLWMVYRTFFGALTNDANRNMADMNGREFALILPLAALMLIMGFAPNPFLQKSENATDFLLETMETKRMAVLDAAADQPVTDATQETTAPNALDAPVVPIRLNAGLDPLHSD